MSLDETLFTLAWRLLRAWRRPAPHLGAPAQVARLEELRPHLTLVARALSGEGLEVREAEDTGGFRGATLYLPPSISLAPTHADNVQAYVYRVAYTVTSRQLGLVLQISDTTPTDVQLFRTLLAVPATLRAVEATLPMTQALRAQFFPLLLDMRPPWPGLETTAACLEALTQVLLGRPWPPSQATPGYLWLQHSLRVAAEGYSETAARTLWSALQRGVPHSSTLGVAPIMLWGQLLPATGHEQRLTPDEAALAAQTAFPTGTELPGKPKDQVRRVQLDQRDIDHIVNRIGDFGFMLAILLLFVTFKTTDMLSVQAHLKNFAIGSGLPHSALCCSQGRWGNRRRYPCTSGCRMRWRAPRQSVRSFMPPPWSRQGST